MFTILTRILFQDQLSKTGTEITYKIFSKKNRRQISFSAFNASYQNSPRPWKSIEMNNRLVINSWGNKNWRDIHFKLISMFEKKLFLLFYPNPYKPKSFIFASFSTEFHNVGHVYSKAYFMRENMKPIPQ